MEIVIPSLYILAGIMVYSTVHHFAIALNQPRDYTQMMFAGICLLAVPFALFHIKSLQATSITGFIDGLRWDLAAILLFLLLFAWFIALYTGNKPWYLLGGLTVLSVVLLVADFAQPYSLQYDRIDGIRILHLPWGESVTRGVGHNGFWIYIGIAGALTVLVHALYSLVGLYRRHRRRTDLYMLLAAGLFLLGSSEGILVRLSIFDFIELGPFCILVFVLVMSMALTNEAQQRLRSSERRFRSLVEQAPFSIQVLAPDGYTRLVNPAWEKLWGMRLEEIGNYSILRDQQLIDKGVMPFIEKGFTGEAAEISPVMYNPADNPVSPGPLRDRWVQGHIYPIKDESGKVVDVILMHEDVTEHKLAEDSLRESETRFRTVIEQSPIGMAFARDGYTVDVNEVYLRMFGYDDIAEVRGQPVIDHIAPQSRAEAKDRARRRMLGEPTENTYETIGLRKDGSEFPLLVSAKRVVLSDGPLTYTFLMDITERKRSEASLKESELRFRTIIEQSPMGISFSRDGYTQDVNGAFLQMFGYSNLAQVRGNPIINQIAPQCRAEMEDRVRRRTEGFPAEITYETTGLRRDGTQFPLFISAKRMVLSDGPISSAFLIDFTERVQMQHSIERIGKLYKMLSEINSTNIHIRERGQLFETVCRIVAESGMVRMACISLLERASGDVIPVAQAGYVEGYLDRLNINIHDEVSGNGPIGMAIKSGVHVACNDIISDPRMAPWRDEALKCGYGACIVYPLAQSGQIIGAFSFYFHDAGSLTDDVIQLLGSLVEDISFTLDFIDESARREQAQNELRELSMFLQSALENERKRIARELHDELGQTMTALHFDLKWMHERIDAGQHELQDRLGSMQSLLERTVSTVRRISEDLRPGMLDDLGLAAAIEHHVEKFAAQTGIVCDLAMNMAEFDLNDQAATALFRIVQESLTNVARHSGANRVLIRLQDMQDKILLIVQDNGRGLPDDHLSRKKTYGLMGMRERVRMLEGVMDIFNEAGAGVRIEVFIPKHPDTRATK